MYPTSIFPASITRETIELRDVVASGVKVWDFDYPSYYKGDQKTAFEQKVLDHFWTRQIGQETVGRFLHYFRRTVREIMPYYIQRYESVDLMNDSEIKPLDNYNMIEEYSSERSESSSGAGTSTATESGSTSETGSVTGETGGATVTSDTPQSTLNLPLNTSGSVTLSHASNAEETRGKTSEERTNSGSTSSESTGSTTSETSGTGTETHTLKRRGNIGVTTYAQLLEGYRETFLNIDMEVINELEVCFLGVF